MTIQIRMIISKLINSFLSLLIGSYPRSIFKSEFGYILSASLYTQYFSDIHEWRKYLSKSISLFESRKNVIIWTHIHIQTDTFKLNIWTVHNPFAVRGRAEKMLRLYSFRSFWFSTLNLLLPTHMPIVRRMFPHDLISVFPCTVPD